MRMVDEVLEGRARPRARRSPFYAVPFLRTNFARILGAATLATLAVAWVRRR
jgi:hypothetical protein